MSTRREFLKTSGALAVGAAASSCKPAAESAPAGESAKMLAANPQQPEAATYEYIVELETILDTFRCE